MYIYVHICIYAHDAHTYAVTLAGNPNYLAAINCGYPLKALRHRWFIYMLQGHAWAYPVS